jgi:hypothetical protein
VELYLHYPYTSSWRGASLSTGTLPSLPLVIIIIIIRRRISDTDSNIGEMDSTVSVTAHRKWSEKREREKDRKIAECYTGLSCI